MKAIFCLFALSLTFSVSFSQQNISTDKISNENYGFILPSIGTINVLIIFSQFPDDNYEGDNSLWPKEKPPADVDKWINETWTDTPLQGSLTHYFNEMSFNKLKFIGKTISVIAPHKRQWYIDSNLTRGDIHREIIQKIDSTMDFKEFDNWTRTPDGHHLNRPDGIIDMIIFIWRNISKGLPNEENYNNKLDFDNDQGDIGGADFTVDNGLRTIRTGAFSSGATIRNYLPDRNKTFRIVVHEVAHFLLGNNDYHNGYGFWGMLSSYGVRSIVANSFERARLGWTNLINISPDSKRTLHNMKLSDYVTTGEAYCLKIDSALGQYFYIENHQNISYWETEFKFGNIEKGLYVIRQDKITPSQGDGSPNSSYLKLISAGGRFDWEVNQLVDNPWGTDPVKLPVFKKLKPDRIYGYTPLEFIPWSLNSSQKILSPILYTENENGTAVQDVKCQGTGHDAFKMGYNELFTPWSNPNSNNYYRNPTVFGFKLNSLDNGIYSLDIYVRTYIEAPPSKPIGLIANIDSISNSVNLVWQANIEPDLSSYEISRQIPEEGDVWKIIGITKDTSYIDSSIDYTSFGKIANYRVRAKDTDNQYSIYSDVQTTNIVPYRKITNADEIKSIKG